MRGEPCPPLGRRQAERLAHGAVEPRPRIGGFRPGAFVQPGDDDQIGRGQPRLHGSEDLQARMRGARRPHGFEPHQAAEQRRIIGERKGKACRFACQRGHEGGDRFAVRAVLKCGACAAFVGGEGGGALDMGGGNHGKAYASPPCELGERREGIAGAADQILRGGPILIRKPIDGGMAWLHPRRALQAPRHTVQSLAAPGLAHGGDLDDPGRVLRCALGKSEARERMFQQRQDRDLRACRRGFGDQIVEQPGGRRAQRLTGAGINADAPAAKLRRHPARQRPVRRDQIGGSLRRLHHLAQDRARSRRPRPARSAR